MSFCDQSKSDARCEWGSPALEHLAFSEVVVIVDVLSFSTCVEVATTRGAKIFPYAWKDETAAAYAEEKQAELAGKRGRGEGKYSLAPTSLLEVPASLRLVLPSPNGSQLAFQAKASGSVVAAGCLRNASALGRWLQAFGKSVAVVPAGERWPDGSLRFAVEDLLGAGAILKEVKGRLSPEAELAVAAFEQGRGNLADALLRAASGRELVERGFEKDVELASQLDASETIPVLMEDCFQAWIKE